MKTSKFVSNINRKITELIGPERVETTLLAAGLINACLTLQWVMSPSEDNENIQLTAYVLNVMITYQARNLRPERGMGYAIGAIAHSFLAASPVANLRKLGLLCTGMSCALIKTEIKTPAFRH